MHFQHNHLNEIICFLMSSMVEKKIEDILSVEILLRGKGGVVARSTPITWCVCLINKTFNTFQNT